MLATLTRPVASFAGNTLPAGTCGTVQQRPGFLLFRCRLGCAEVLPGDYETVGKAWTPTTTRRALAVGDVVSPRELEPEPKPVELEDLAPPTDDRLCLIQSLILCVVGILAVALTLYL